VVGELIGGLALLAALGTLALAGSAISKAEKKFNEMVQTQINPLRDRIAELETGFDQITKALKHSIRNKRARKKSRINFSSALAKFTKR